MRILKQKLMTIVTFWLLTGLVVFSLPVKDAEVQKSVSYKLKSDTKVSSVHLGDLENL